MMPEPARTFRFALRVPYAHTDQMRVVYYANYLVYFEMARAAMMREIGLPYGDLERRGVILPVIEAHCVYKAPARFDDELTVASRCALAGPRLRVDYDLARGDDILATGYTVHACVSPAGRVLRPPADLRRLVAPAPGPGQGPGTSASA